MKLQTDSAVSPVVGVMLMIVVTVVIAAVVGIAASGSVGDTEKSPVVNIDYLGSVQGNDFVNGYSGEIGLLFELTGGDKFHFQDITLTLTQNKRGVSEEVTIAMFDDPKATVKNPEPGFAKLYDSALNYRFKKVGVTTANGKLFGNQEVHPGERFIVYVDKIEFCEGASCNKAHVIITRDGVAYSEGVFDLNAGTQYQIKDTKTGNVIASGNLVGKIFTKI